MKKIVESTMFVFETKKIRLWRYLEDDIVVFTKHAPFDPFPHHRRQRAAENYAPLEREFIGLFKKSKITLMRFDA